MRLKMRKIVSFQWRQSGLKTGGRHTAVAWPDLPLLPYPTRGSIQNLGVVTPRIDAYEYFNLF
jgi:hypothetical protein